jgi:hypothetical protein
MCLGLPELKFTSGGECCLDKKALRRKIISRHKTPDPLTFSGGRRGDLRQARSIAR